MFWMGMYGSHKVMQVCYDYDTKPFSSYFSFSACDMTKSDCEAGISPTDIFNSPFTFYVWMNHQQPMWKAKLD